MTIKNLWPLLSGALLLSGCATTSITTITNMTPSQQERNANGLYTFEALWSTRDATIHPETIHPYVLIGLEAYPMQPTPLMANRWETVIPIPASNNFVNYRYKFDYEYNSIPIRQKGSKLSAPFQTQILDK